VSDDDRGTGTADELRQAFDAAFAAPLRDGRSLAVALLAIRVGADPYALRVLEAGGLVQLRAIVPVPSRRTELLGVMGLRGAVVPVYSLARLLGHSAQPEEPRWAALCGGEERVALAFAAFEGRLQVPAGELGAPPAERGALEHVAHLATVGGAPRPVLSLPSILRAITGH
jgi:chemotaxis signal transduction protein